MALKALLLVKTKTHINLILFMFPLIVTISAGFTHAFESDHLLAVSNMVSQRNSFRHSLKDGLFWGLGHTSTILIVGALMMLLKINIAPHYFHFFEVSVGVMLVLLGLYRLLKINQITSIASKVFNLPKKNHETHILAHLQHSTPPIVAKKPHLHIVSYNIGALHGLAGSGELVLLAMLQIAYPQMGMLYLLSFGAGAIAGMVVAAFIFSLPFSKNIFQKKPIQLAFMLTSSLLCILLGGNIIYQNLHAI
jgi:high-affinity nickel permease